MGEWKAEIKPIIWKQFHISKRIERLKNHSLPICFLKTQIACLSSHSSVSYEEAVNLLDSIKYTPDDYNWLGDIILLAESYAAHKLNFI